jgi:hypothetical protein
VCAILALQFLCLYVIFIRAEQAARAHVIRLVDLCRAGHLPLQPLYRFGAPLKVVTVEL